MTCKNIPGAKTRAPSAANPQPRPSAGKRAGTSPKLRAAGGKRRISRAAKTREIRNFAVISPRAPAGWRDIFAEKSSNWPVSFLPPAALRRISGLWRPSPLRRLAERRKRPASPVFSPSRPAHKKIRGLPRITRNYMVVGTGFEPVNGKAERIYSPRPLAPWIPYHRVN